MTPAVAAPAGRGGRRGVRDLLLAGDPDAATLGFRGADPGLLAERADDSPLRAPAADRRAADLLAPRPRAAGVVERGWRAGRGRRTGRPASRDAGAGPRAGPGRRPPAAVQRPGGGATSPTCSARAHLRDGVPWAEMAVIVRGSPARPTAAARAELVRGAGRTCRPPRSRSATRARSGRCSMRFAVSLRSGCDSTPSGARRCCSSPIGGADAVTLRRLRRALRGRGARRRAAAGARTPCWSRPWPRSTGWRPLPAMSRRRPAGSARRSRRWAGGRGRGRRATAEIGALGDLVGDPAGRATGGVRRSPAARRGARRPRPRRRRGAVRRGRPLRRPAAAGRPGRVPRAPARPGRARRHAGRAGAVRRGRGAADPARRCRAAVARSSSSPASRRGSGRTSGCAGSLLGSEALVDVLTGRGDGLPRRCDPPRRRSARTRRGSSTSRSAARPRPWW